MHYLATTELEQHDTAPLARAPRGQLTEAELEALAAEVLSITSEAELDQFLGDVFRKVGAFAKKGAHALGEGLKAVGKVALPVLKDVAKVGLPVAGKALGSFIGGPAGGAIGGQLGSLAAGLIKEVQAIPAEDRDFEAAKRYAQLVTSAAHELATQPPVQNSQVAALRAITAAARGMSGGGKHGAQNGRWVRQGGTIVVEGL